MRRLLGLAAMALEVTVSVIGEVIEFWGSGETREELSRQVRRWRGAADRLQEELHAMTAERDALLNVAVIHRGQNDARRGECVCGETFRTAEDYRDHLPCEP